MRVSYDEGLASHIGPESCGSVGDDDAEALTGVRAGWVSSHENVSSGAPTACVRWKATPGGPSSQDPPGLRGVLDPMHARKHLARKPGDPRPGPPVSGSAP